MYKRQAVFPEGSFEREGHPEDEKCNGVLTVIEGEKARDVYKRQVGTLWQKIVLHLMEHIS